MREHMGAMKNQFKAKATQKLDDLVHCIDSPFIANIMDFPLPSKFKMPQLESFDGTKDLLDYLESFKTIMQLQGIPEEIMCRVFPMAFQGFARVWFNKLEAGSIGSFI